MLNFQFTQNIIANFAPKANTQAATDVVNALAGSFAPKPGQENERGADFSAALSDVSAKTQEVRRTKISESNAENDANRDIANAQKAVRPDKPAPKESNVDSQDDKLSAPKPKAQNDALQSSSNGKEKGVSANDNAPVKDGKLDAEKIIDDVQDTIDQIDLALASGGEQLSAEMAALLAAMKQLLQQVLQQFNLALQSGVVEGTDTVQLDSKAFAPLLKQLGQLVDQLKKANAELAAALGFGDADLDSDAKKSNMIVGGITTNGNQVKTQSVQSHFSEIDIRITHVASLLQRASDAAQNPVKHALQNLQSGQVDASQFSAPAVTLIDAAVDAALKSGALDAKAVDTPVPLVLQSQTQGAQPQQGAVQQLQAATSTGGQSSSQFGQSGQGGQQAVISQPSSAQNVNNQQVLAKDAPSFDHVLKAPVKGSASEQVAFQMKAMIKDGNSKMIVKLDPPELGELEIRMQVSRLGKTDLVISVERPQTLELLQKDSRLLLQALTDSGLQTDSGSMSFNLKGENPNGGQRQGNNPYPVIVEETFDEDLLQVATKTYTTDVQHGVNIHI